MGIFVRPGMSTSVRLGTLGEKTVSWMGSGETALPLAFRYLPVSTSISALMASNDAIFCLPLCRNSPYSAALGSCRCTSWRMRGRRVTMPVPRGRKSRPTTASRTEDLPED